MLMSHLLLAPPIAFLAYLGLVSLLALIGRWLVGPVETSQAERAPFASGEAPPRHAAAPGYRQFFVIALFFVVLHLGALVLGSGSRSFTAILYLAGLFLALVALILG